MYGFCGVLMEHAWIGYFFPISASVQRMQVSRQNLSCDYNAFDKSPLTRTSGPHWKLWQPLLVHTRPGLLPNKAAVDTTNTAMSQPATKRTRKVPQILFSEDHGIYSEFATSSPHPILYDGALYPTAEHLFQALKFVDGRPDIAEYIRTSSPRPSQAHSLGKAYQAFVREDWHIVQIAKMNEIITLKFSQHPELVKLLLGTGDAELVENSNDAFWGIGPDKKGRNEYGKALMRLRSKLVQISKRHRSRASSTSS